MSVSVKPVNKFLRSFRQSIVKKTTTELVEDAPLITLSKFLILQQASVPIASGVLTNLMEAVQAAIKGISNEVNQFYSPKIFKKFKAGKLQKSEQQVMEALAHKIFTSLVINSGVVSLLVSRYEDEVIKAVSNQGDYFICYNALDGAEKMLYHGPVGTIFGIYTKPRGPWVRGSDILRPGRKLAAAGYALYGTSTVLVIAFANQGGVHEFVLDHSLGEFLLSDCYIDMPSQGRVYSANEGYSDHWDKEIRDYLFKKKDPKMGRPYAGHFIGTLSADIHRIIKTGGIYLYPANKHDPNGKFCLLYECSPMALLIKEAGGLATNGTMSILDVEPTHIHEKQPFYLGSRRDVAELMEVITISRALNSGVGVQLRPTLDIEGEEYNEYTQEFNELIKEKKELMKEKLTLLS